MKKFFRFLSVAAAYGIFITFPVIADASEPAGLWLTENHRAVIRIAPCQTEWCGTVYWIIPGGLQTDSKNPDVTQRGRAMCGLPVLSHFRQSDATHFIDGNIYKADDGDTYHATLQLLPNGKLLVHGYIGMPLFGVSQLWTPASGKDYQACRG